MVHKHFVTTLDHPRIISSAPHVYNTSPTVLSGMALNQHFHWFAVAMLNNSPHAMRMWTWTFTLSPNYGVL